MKTNIHQLAQLQSLRGICSKAGLKYTTIFRKVKEGRELSENEAEALGDALHPFIHWEAVEDVIACAQAVVDSWESGNLAERVSFLDAALHDLKGGSDEI